MNQNSEMIPQAQILSTLAPVVKAADNSLTKLFSLPENLINAMTTRQGQMWNAVNTFGTSFSSICVAQAEPCSQVSIAAITEIGNSDLPTWAKAFYINELVKKYQASNNSTLKTTAVMSMLPFLGALL